MGMFHHRELNMWVIAEGEDSLTSLGSEKIVARSGVSGLSVIPTGGYEQWTWEQILPYCMDMNENKCKYDWYKPDETSRSLMHKSFPFSEKEDGTMVTQFTYKVIVDGKEVKANAPVFTTNVHGYARGLTDAGML